MNDAMEAKTRVWKFLSLRRIAVAEKRVGFIHHDCNWPQRFGAG